MPLRIEFYNIFLYNIAHMARMKFDRPPFSAVLSVDKTEVGRLWVEIHGQADTRSTHFLRALARTAAHLASPETRELIAGEIMSLPGNYPAEKTSISQMYKLHRQRTASATAWVDLELDRPVDPGQAMDIVAGYGLLNLDDPLEIIKAEASTIVIAKPEVKFRRSTL